MKKQLKKIRDYNKVLHYKYLSRKKYPEEIKKWYKYYTGEDIDFNNIKNFNQYIQFLKINDNNELKQELVDKYRMRQYVIDNIGEQYLPILYGVYDKFDEIDFKTLPKKFVLKCNHGCGMNVIVKDKSEINIELLKKQFAGWMKMNFAYKPGLEMQYKDIKPKIICEEYLGDDLIDIQAWCSEGNILFLSYIKSPHGGNYKASFDEKWNRLDFVTSPPILNEKIEKPKNLDKIIEVSKKVSKNMKFLRFDFYIQTNGEIKISEFTFTPANGLIKWCPKETNELIYNKIKMNK